MSFISARPSSESTSEQAVGTRDPEPATSGDAFDEPRPSAVGWSRILVAALVGVLGALASFKFRTVPVPTDPWHYVIAGQTFPAESWNTVGLTRYGLSLPMIPITRLFHESELSFYLTPCLATGLLLGGVYWLTSRFFGWIAGCAAAVLTLANGVVLGNSSRLYPDVFAVAMTVLAVVTAVMARDIWARRPQVSTWLVTMLLLTGTFVGLSWWMRETALLAWPIVGAVLLWRGGPRPRISLPLVAVPAVGLLLLEMLISKLAFGDAMLRFEALTGPDMSATTNQADVPYLGQSRMTYLLTMPKGALLFEDGRWMVAMAVIAVLSGIAFPRKVGLFAAWFVLVFGLFTLVGGGLSPEHPRIRLDVARYWIAFLPPMVIAAVGGVTLVVRLLGERLLAGRSHRLRVGLAGVLALALVAGPVAASAQGVRQSPPYVVTNGNEGAEFRNWLHGNDKSVGRVYSDWMSGRVLPTYALSFTGDRMAKVRWLSLTGLDQPRVGDHVVLYSAYSPVCFFCGDNLHTSWLHNHRGDLRRWDRVWKSKDSTFVVYRVTEKSRPDGAKP